MQKHNFQLYLVHYEVTLKSGQGHHTKYEPQTMAEAIFLKSLKYFIKQHFNNKKIVFVLNR